MKDSVTKFDFDDAFKALDEIEIPVAEKGIKANRIDLKESMRKVDKFELLFEDFYDVNNAEDMNTASEEREAEVAKAKLARIEKIVDLDAETEEDILPSYVGKTIIQCPQCMTLFYKDAEDIVRDEENPDVVNVNEVCQHCGNESGYDVVGKVAEETETTPGDELGTDDFSAEVGDGENDIAIDDGSETTEEAPAEEDGEVDELSAEADLDSLDLDTELDLDLEEEPAEEEEEIKEESLNTSELLKKIEDKNDLKTEHESEKLTLNEGKEKIAYIDVSGSLNASEDKLTTKAKKDGCTTIYYFDSIDYKEPVEAAKAGAEIILYTDDDYKVNRKEIADIKNITIVDVADIIKEALTEDIEDNLDAALKDHEEYIDYLRNAISQEEAALSKATNEQVKKAIQKRIDAFREDLEAALPDAVKAEAQEEELPDAEEAGLEDATDNTSDETEATNDKTEETTESLQEAVESITDTLNRAWEVAKKTNSPIGVTVVTPIGAGTMDKLKEWSKTVSANLYYVDAKNPDLMANGFDENMISRPDTVIVIDEFDRAPADTQKAISNEIDNLDTQVEMVIAISHDSNLGGDNFKRFKQYVATVEKETTTESLTEDVSMTSSPENFKKLLGTKEFKEPISQEEVESYFESVDVDVDDDETEENEDEISITVEGDDSPVTLNGSDEETLTEGPIKWVTDLVGKAKNKAAAKVKAKSDATTTQKLATIIKHFGFKNFYIIPYADTRATARFLADNKEFYSPKENYYKDKKRFMINANTGGRDFPEHIKLDVGDIAALSVDEIASKVNDSFIKAKDNLQALSSTEATSFIDLLGSKSLATVPRGKEFEEDVKSIKLAYIEIVGVKGELPQAGESMSEADSKALMGQSKNIYWLYKFENGKGELNADLLNAASSASETGTSDNDAFSDPSYKKGIETKISAFNKIAMIKLVSEGQVNFVEVDDATIDNYEELRTKCLQNSSTTDETYYMMVLSPELEDISTDGDDEVIKEVPKEVVTNLVTEKFTQGKAKLWTKFTGKVPETAKPKTDDEGKEKPTGDADGKEKPTDDVDKEKKGEAPSTPANMTEPKSNEDYAFYIEQFKAAKKKLALVTIGSDGTVLCKDDPDEATTDNLKELRELLKAYPTFLGCDNGIIVVDPTFTKSDKPVEVDCDKFCIERITKDDKISTNYSNVAKAIGVKTSKIEKHFGLIDDEDDDAEVMDYAESLKVTDIDEKSFNEKLTESLVEVYSNVDSFTMTNCTLEESILTVTGDIKFTSGKVKTTHYIFEAVQNADEITLTGKNQTLFESGEIKVTCRILAETLQAGTLTYKYNIGQKLVEGLILNK